MKVQPSLPRGMRDILPSKMLRRRYVIGLLEEAFERFGFEPLQTPAVEKSETLHGKHGPEAEKLMYEARHKEGKEELALRYDLTVPLARIIAMYPDLVKPFKRYQIAPVWRAERPQKGRYREFYQCDADIVGSGSMLADAEIISLIYDVMNRLGFKKFVTQINNRKILVGIGEYAGVLPELLGGLYRSIDKLGKIGLPGVKEELAANQIPAETIDRLMDLLLIPGSDLEQVRARLANVPLAVEGIDELVELRRLLGDFGIPQENFEIDFTMVRGLEYYTGPIYETVVTEPKIGSLTGGGRYDELIGLFSNKSLPVTGTSFGIERIIDVMEELEMYPPNLGATIAQVLVTVFDAATRPAAIQVAHALREAGIRTELYLNPDNLGKQLKYASTRGIPAVVIVGPDEAAAGKVTLRDMGTGAQETVALGMLTDRLGSRAKLE